LEMYRAGKQRVGLIGGTFDPIHYGHLVIAEEVRATLNLAEMVFIPAGQPPHKAGHTNAATHQRLAMLKLALATNPHFTISRVEIDRAGLSYLVDTLRILQKQWGNQTELSFVMGWDSLEEFHNWYQPLGILDQLTQLIAVGRPGHVEESEYIARLEARLPGISQKLLILPVPQLEISSTDLRRRVAEGKPIKYQVPEAVEQYIMEHGLY